MSAHGALHGKRSGRWSPRWLSCCREQAATEALWWPLQAACKQRSSLHGRSLPCCAAPYACMLGGAPIAAYAERCRQRDLRWLCCRYGDELDMFKNLKMILEHMEAQNNK